MHITLDQVVYWQLGPLKIGATLVYTWLVMAVLVLLSWLVTRNLKAAGPLSRGQNLLEAIVLLIGGQIREISGQGPKRYLPFIGTLFLFIVCANLLGVVPGLHAPTGSLSTTFALALCVFFAVPIYGVRQHGLTGYLKEYLEPSPVMLPFHILGELSRTVSLAVRLFGNMMGGATIAAILLVLAPLFFPVVMQAFELLMGFIQAFIFSILAMVYIASATRAHEKIHPEIQPEIHPAKKAVKKG